MRHPRRLLPIVLALGLAAVPAATLAHAELVSTDPAAGASLDDPPSEVVITFDGELDPVSGFTVTHADGDEVGVGEVDLEVAERNVLRGAVTITEPGVYTVSWTAISDDGHAEEGTFSFGYLAGASDETEGGHDDEGETPDTALSAPATNGSLGAGVVLLLVALAMTVRRLVAVRSRA